MINVRRNIFETNSSSNHNLTIIKDDIFQKWMNHEVVLKIEYDYDPDFENDHFFSTWGNFFLEQGKYEVAPIEEQKERNMKILSKYLELKEEVSSKLVDLINKYNDTGDINLVMNCIDDLYLTPEEYEESLNLTDCQSPFQYSGEGVVIIGHYYRD